MALVGSLGVSVVAKTDDFEKGMGRARRELKDTQTAAAQTGQSFEGFARSLGAVAVAAISLNTLKNQLSDIVKVGTELNSLRAAFTAVTGSAKSGGEALAFVRETADRLGASFQPLAEAYKGIAASARGTNLEGAQTSEIFTSVVTASRALQLSSEDTKGVLLAVQQIMSKGTVQAEELRGQIGERLPGAFNIAARAIGVSTEELNKLLEQGKVLSVDFLPKFARQLQAEFGTAAKTAGETAQGAFARFGNELVLLKDRLAQEILPGLARVAGYAADILKARRQTGEQEADVGQRRAEQAAGGARRLAALQAKDQQELRDVTEELDRAQERLNKAQADGVAPSYLEGLRGIVDGLRQQQTELRAVAKAREAGLSGTANRLADATDSEDQLRLQAELTRSIGLFDNKARDVLKGAKDDIAKLNAEAKLTPGLLDLDAEKAAIFKKRAEELREVLIQRAKVPGAGLPPKDLSAGLGGLQRGSLDAVAAIEAKSEAEREAARLQRENEQAQEREARTALQAFSERQQARDREREALQAELDQLTLSREALEDKRLAQLGLNDAVTQGLLLQVRAAREERAAQELALEVIRDRIAATQEAEEQHQRVLAKARENARKTDLREERRKVKDLKEIYADFADSVTDGLLSITEIGKRSVKDLLESFVQDLLRSTTRAFLRPALGNILEKGIALGASALGGLFGGQPGSLNPGLGDTGLGSVPGLASGGPVMPGKFYRVGENGPELLYAGSSGQVIPNGTDGGWGGVNVTFNLGVGADAQSIRRSQGEITSAIYRTVQAAQRNI